MTMKIIASINYYHAWGCELSDCERHYCPEHRMLWRDCDTAVKAGDDSGAHWWDLEDCPHCMRDSRLKQFLRMSEEKRRQMYAHN